MTKLLFIDAINYLDKSRRFETSVDNPGLLYIASSLRERFDCVDIKIIYKDIEQTLDNFKPQIVGISSVTQNFNIAKKYATLAKRAECSVIMGGAHISALPHIIPDNVDVGCVGEGEQTIVELMELYEGEKTFTNKSNLRKIKGIVYRDGDNIIQTEPRPLIEPLDKIPFPDRDLSYLNRGVGIFTSRGCPYKCRFCFTSHHWKKIRFFSPEYVIREIEELVEKRRVTWIQFYDDLFVSNRERLIKIVNLIKERGIHKLVSFVCNVRANHVDEQTASLLKEMNVRAVFIGIESGTQRILNYLKGNTITVEQNKKAVEYMKKQGIRCSAGIIIGSPTETREEILDTLRFVKESKLDSFYVFTLTPLPGTPVWDYALKRGLVSNDMDWDKLRIEFGEIPDRAIVLSETLTRDELFELYRLFEKEKWIRDFKINIFYPLKYLIKHPLIFCKKVPDAIRKGYISRVIASFYQLVKLRGSSFGSKKKNYK